MAVWQEKRLGDIFSLKYGKSSDKMIPGSEYKVFSSSGLFGLSNSKLADKGIIVGRKGSVGSVFFSRNPFYCIDTTFYIDNTNNENMLFIYYYLKNMKLNLYNSDAAVPGLNKHHLERCYCIIPDLVTQEKIADILSTYDDLIENNNRRIEILEQMAQEIYKEWFVRFRFPGHEKVKFVNGIPEDWEVVKLGDFVNIKGGKRLPTGKDFCIEQTEHPYIRIRDISKYKFIPLTKNMMYIDNATFNILNRFTVKKGDLLISIVGTIGLVACVGSTLNGANLTENCVNITEVRHFTKSYLYHYLNSSQGQGELYSGIVGVSQPKLPIYNIKKFKLLKPSQKLIIDFTNLVADIDSKMNNLLEQNQNLIKQRDLLLPRLMSGKLEV